MEYPLAEMIDRLSILALKRERLPADRAIEVEFLRLRDATFDTALDGHQICAWYATLYDVNGRIWDLESDIRRGREGDLGLEEVGRRALAIREINGERVRIKAEIALAVGEFAEPKVDHGSEIDAR